MSLLASFRRITCTNNIRTVVQIIVRLFKYFSELIPVAVAIYLSFLEYHVCNFQWTAVEKQ